MRAGGVLGSRGRSFGMLVRASRPIVGVGAVLAQKITYVTTSE